MEEEEGEEEEIIIFWHLIFSPPQAWIAKCVRGCMEGKNWGDTKSIQHNMFMEKMAEVVMAILKERNAFQSQSMAIGHGGQTSAKEWIHLLWIIREKVGGGFCQKQPGPQWQEFKMSIPEKWFECWLEQRLAQFRWTA